MPITQMNFTRDLDSLAMVFDLIDKFTADRGVDDKAKHAVSVAVDELFTNMVKYHPSNRNPITVELRADRETMTVHLIDRDVDRFDPTNRPAPYLGSSLTERTPTGLGIFLTKQLMDDVQYRYGDRTSLIILKKRYQKHYV